MNYAEDFGVDAEIVSKATTIYKGYAQALSDEILPEHAMLRASCTVYAASYAAVAFPQEAAHWFTTAAWTYHEALRTVMEHRIKPERERRAEPAPSPFALALAGCAADRAILRKLIGDGENFQPDRRLPNDFMGHLLMAVSRLTGEDVDASGARSQIERLVEGSEALGRFSVGRLQFPLRRYINAARYLGELGHRRNDERRFEAGWEELFLGIDETFSLASQTAPWRKLDSALLPVEPEILVWFRALRKMARRSDEEIDFGKRFLPERLRWVQAYWRLAAAIEFNNNDDRENRAGEGA